MELRRFRATCPALATASLLVLVACTDNDSAMGDPASSELETRLYDVTSGATGSPTYQLTGQPVSSAVTVDSGTFDERATARS